MLDTKTAYDANIYTNFQGLDSLHYDYKSRPDEVKKEVAQQFESLLVQMLLKSMRDTNKEFSDDGMKSNQTGFYQDLFDKQLSLVLSKSGIGIAKTIENFLDKKQPSTAEPTVMPSAGLIASPLTGIASSEQPQAVQQADNEVKQPNNSIIQPLTVEKANVASFENTNDFVKALWSSAKEAAQIIGVDPKLLLAQAALETNWGKNIIPHEDGGSTHNLFNIKADKSWSSKFASFSTIEQRDNVLIKEKSKFRAYNSYLDSFIDYADFLKQNNRYTEALQNASDPKKFVQSLQNANYATDSLYSEKVMDIFSSRKFNALFTHLN